MREETQAFASAPPILTNAKDPFAVAQWANAMVRWLTVRVVPEGMGVIDSDDIKDGGIETVDLADNCVTNAKMADNSVDTAELVDNAATTAKIPDSNVTTAKIADNNVTTAKIANNNVTPAKLQDMAANYIVCGSDAGTVAALVAGDVQLHETYGFCRSQVTDFVCPMNVDGELMFAPDLFSASAHYEFFLMCADIIGT